MCDYNRRGMRRYVHVLGVFSQKSLGEVYHANFSKTRIMHAFMHRTMEDNNKIAEREGW